MAETQKPTTEYRKLKMAKTAQPSKRPAARLVRKEEPRTTRRVRKIIKRSCCDQPQMAMVPLPYVAMTAGWVFREAGRQPWVVYGVLRTEDAVSDLSAGAMALSLAVFGTLFAVLIAVNTVLLLRTARRGPTAPLSGPLPPPTPLVPPGPPVPPGQSAPPVAPLAGPGPR